MYFRLMAAISDLRVAPTSKSIDNSLTVLLDTENMGTAVGVPLPAAIQDLQSVLHVFSYRCHIRHFDFRLNTVGFQHGVTL